MDTKSFDDKIDALNLQIPTLQTDLDNDTLNVQLKTVQKKAEDLGKAQNELAAVKSRKSTFIAIQATIDQKTQEIVDLEQQKLDLVNSVK